MANKIELSMLAVDAYSKPGQATGYGRFKPLDQDNPLSSVDNKAFDKNTGKSGSGLLLHTYIDEKTKEVVISIAGSNDGKDWLKTDPKFFIGGYNPQFQEAIEHALKVKQTYEDNGYKVSVTGHSLGGGIAQVLSHTFGWDGISTDAPAASKIINSDGYNEQVNQLVKDKKIDKPSGPGNFTNFTEHGSLVSSVPFATYVGKHMEFNLVNEKGKWLSSALVIGGVDPLTKALGAYLGAKNLIAQHDKENFPGHFLSKLDPDNIDGYHYEKGQWFKTQEVAFPDDAEERGEPTTEKAQAHPELAKKLDAKRELYLELNNDQKALNKQSNQSSEPANKTANNRSFSDSQNETNDDNTLAQNNEPVSANA